MADLHDERLHLPYQVIDSGQGPYLFMMHGMLSSHRQWRLNLDSLCRRVRPVLFDLWGHGDAPCPLDSESYQVSHILAELDRAREALGAERILLCGQSLGACFTLRYAIEHPQRVIGQIFTNSVSALSAPDAMASSEQRQARAAQVERDGRRAIEQLPFHPRHAQRLPEEMRQELIDIANAVDPRAFARLSTITGPQLSVANELARTRCPTLLVNGLWEKSFQPLRDQAALRIPGLQIADVPAGHAVQLENAPAFNQATDAFLAQLLV